MVNESQSDRSKALREKATELAPPLLENAEQLDPKAVQELIHELQVHQIELELQNEQLLETQVQLQESQRKYLDLYNHAPVGYLTLDPLGTILEANATAVEQLGAAYASLINVPLIHWIVPNDRMAVRAALSTLASGRPPATIEVGLTVRPTSFAQVDIRPGAGGHEGTAYLVTLTDITARRHAEDENRRLEAKILQAQKLESLGVLAGGVAHDFNNILAAILGNAELAATEIEPASAGSANLANIKMASLRASDLCRQMLAYAGEGHTVVGSASLSTLVREMVQLLTVSMGANCELRCLLADEIPLIQADSSQIRQIVMNLITNASEAIGSGPGVITVTTGIKDCDREYMRSTVLGDETATGRYVFLEVGDTGCGIDNKMLRTIFDPFFSTKFTGRGLGLAAVLGIVRGHRGAIRVQSHVGTGTTFEVLFPVTAEQHALPKPASRIENTWQGEGTVLLVEDDELVRAMELRRLQKMGFSVIEACDGVEAVARFREHADEVVCVLLDLTMSRMDGETALAELRKIREDVRVIVISGYSEQDLAFRSAGMDVDGILRKPYRAQTLALKLREVLEADERIAG